LSRPPPSSSSSFAAAGAFPVALAAAGAVFFSSAAGLGLGSGFFPIFGGGFFKTLGYSSIISKSSLPGAF